MMLQPDGESGDEGRASGWRFTKLRPGAWISDQIRLLRHIGKGGMGSVWSAQHLGFGIDVAVKFMAPDLAERADARERFRREAESAMRLRGPNLARIFDHVEPEQGVPYIVMQLLEGEDLHTRLELRGVLTLAQTVEVVTQAAAALGEAHRLGIVHRDIKPENLFLTPRPGGGTLLKVLDFGVAMERASPSLRLTGTGTALGTPIYMSPEQLLSAKDVDQRCDLWSLAVVAYLCLTGHALFARDTFGAVCVAIERGRVAPPSTLRDGLPEAVDAWFARALAHDIGDRFRSASEMAEALAEAVNAPPSVTRRSVAPSDGLESPGLQTPPVWVAATAPAPHGGSWRTPLVPLFAVAVLLVVSELDAHDDVRLQAAASPASLTPPALLGPTESLERASGWAAAASDAGAGSEVTVTWDRP